VKSLDDEQLHITLQHRGGFRRIVFIKAMSLLLLGFVLQVIYDLRKV